jgi:hypothetical protein
MILILLYIITYLYIVSRSAMVNLTVDMFGHSVNLLEFGGRVQGLDRLLYTYFGGSAKESGREGGFGKTDIISQEKLAKSKTKVN